MLLMRRAILMALVILAMAAPFFPSAPSMQRVSSPTSPGDWPTYLHDASRSSASADTTLTKATVPYLQQKFATVTGGMIAAEPAVVNGIAYIGSWDGYEYAMNATTGAMLWKTFLGKITDPPCVPPTMGVTSSATVSNGVVYVGGADDSNNQEQWYALSAATGAILWSVPTGLGTQAGGYYNWSSPLIITDPADGQQYGYIGIASVCDAPLIQGKLLKVSLTTHAYVGEADMVPAGQVGGGIWTSPTYDASTNRIFVSTGTLNLYSQTLSQAVVAIDASSMNVVDSWQLPFEAAVSDSDWGTTPTLTTDSQGHQLVSLANKNGILYTLSRTNLAAGPIWQRRIAYGGDCPTCGDGSISSGTFANGVLYYAGGSNTDSNGIGHQGSVTAFDPGTGAVLWTRETNSAPLGSIIEDNGMIFDGQGAVVEALDATTGASLWTYKIGAGTYGAPAIANGMLYLGALNGKFYGFGLPATLPSPPPPDPNCPAGFTCQNIGNTGIAGSEQVNADGSVTVTAGGNGRNQGDEMRLITASASGDFQISTEDLSETKGNLTGYSQPQLGIVIRQSAQPGAPFYTALQDPTYPAEGENVANVIMYYRDTWGGPVVELTQSYPQAFPRWLMVQRHNDTFQTLFSTNGTNWTLISATVHTIVMPTTLLAGMGIASGARSVATTATYSHLTIAPTSTPFVEQNEPHACPTSWSCYDVGAGSPIGDETLGSGKWTISGGGEGVNLATDGLGNNRVADQFHYVYQRSNGDGLLTGELTGLSNGSANAQATIMMRADTSSTSAFYGVVVTPNLNAVLQWRTYNGIQQRTTIPLGTIKLPEWFQINRFTVTTSSPAVTYYSLLTSSDGKTWTQVPASTQALNLGAQPLEGIGGSQATPKALNTSTWTNVTATTGGSFMPPGVCPQAYTCADVGNGFAPGNQEYNASTNTWNFDAGGSDIWSDFDQFHFVSQPINGDGTVSAEVTSVGAETFDTEWEKAGVMMRQSADPQAPYYGVFATPQHGLAVQWRTTQAGFTNQVTVAGPSPEYPVYLMVGRWTDPHPGGLVYYTAYWSTDNKTFTPIPGSTQALPLTGTLLAGMAADSYNEKTTVPVGFSNFALFDGTELPPAGSCPAAVAGCADIGGAAPIGTQTLTTTNGVTDLSMNAGGGDIWSAADQFHYVWQNLAGDGSVSADVASQQNTGAWAKAGVMLRQSTDPGAPYYALFTTPSQGLAVQWRSSAGALTQQLVSAGGAPVYLKVSRYTDSSGTQWYSAYTSSDGVTWNWLPGSTQNLTLTAPLLAGWAASSWNQGVASAVTFHAIAVTTTPTLPPGACASGWQCTDIGGATPAGTQDQTGPTWSVLGGGGDIWNTADQFHFVAAPMSADGTISAQVVSQSNTSAWAKAGVMMRASTDPGSPYYAVLVTPSNGIAVQWRSTQGGASSQQLVAGIAPAWLRVARWTDTSASPAITYYTAMTSSDGTTWTQVPGSTVALNLGASFLSGVAVTSHSQTALSTVSVSSVAIGSTSSEPSGICTAAFTCADIGAPTPAGTQTQSSGTWSVQAGGGDIWGTADQFRYIWQGLTGDGDTTVHLASLGSLGSVNPWSKAGLMVRADTTPGAAYYGVLATPGNGIQVQYRAAAGASTVQVAALGGTAPQWLKVTRSGTTFSASTSSDGVTWTVVPGSTITAPALSGTLLSGLAVTSHDTSQLVTAMFDSLVIP